MRNQYLVSKHVHLRCNTLQHTATHCNALLQTYIQNRFLVSKRIYLRCATLQHTATHACPNTYICAVTHCNILQHTTAHRNTLQHTATHCNTLQHPARHIHSRKNRDPLLQTLSLLQDVSFCCRTSNSVAGHPASFAFQQFLPPSLLLHPTNSVVGHLASFESFHNCVCIISSQFCLHNTHSCDNSCDLKKQANYRVLISTSKQGNLGQEMQHTKIPCNTLQHTATPCNTLQHLATHCNTLQHSCTYFMFKAVESRARDMGHTNAKG